MDYPFWEGQLLSGALVGRRKLYYRVVWVDTKKARIFIRAVQKECPTTTSRSREYPFNEIVKRLKNGVLSEVDECVRPPEMSIAHEDLEKEARASSIQSSRMATLGVLITPVGRAAFYESRRSRSRIMRKQTTASGVSASRLLYLLTVYENFGCCLFALRPYPAAASRTRSTTSQKTGRKNVFEREDPRSPQKGYRVTRWALRHIQWAVWHWVIRLGAPYEVARVLMHRVFWHQDVGSKMLDTRRRYSVHTSKMVSPTQFGYYARRYKQKPEKLRALVGSRGWLNLYAAGRGVAGDIALGPGDILAMDGSTAKYEIVSFTRRRAVGRPTLKVVCDQACGAVVSLEATTRPESANTYREVLLRAMISTKTLMKSLGLPEDYFPYKASPNDLFTDRGPANSNRFRDMVADKEGLDKGMLIAPPACGRAKGVAEGLINIITKRLSKLDGGFTRERTERARDGRRDAPTVAKITRREFLRYAYEAAREHNDSLAFQYYTAKMRRAGIKPTRGEIYKFSIDERKGDERDLMNESEAYASLLFSIKKKMRRNGVYCRKTWFTSDEYQRAYEIEISRVFGDAKKLPEISVMHDPADPTIVFWRRGPKDYVPLRCPPSVEARWEGMLVEDIETDIAEDDQKTVIKEIKRKTFNAPLPSFMIDAFIKGRAKRHVVYGSSDTAGDRAEEEEMEQRERYERSRVSSSELAKSSVLKVETDLEATDDGEAQCSPASEDEHDDDIRKRAAVAEEVIRQDLERRMRDIFGA